MSYADLAFEYLRQGYSPLPLPPRAKKSPPDDWTGADAPMASGADVQEWVESVPENANIALRLPKGVIVLDVDNHKHPAIDTMLRAIEDLGPLPVIGRSNARADDPVSGHRLFRVPEDAVFLGNLKSAGYGDGVDIIQHHHRYIVAPGSVHPDGGLYRWYPTADGPEHFPAVAELPELPARWVEALTKRAEPAITHVDDTSTYDALSDSDRSRIDSYMNSTLAALWGEMDAMKTWPEGKTDSHGGWEEGMLARTARLASLVLADWSPLTRDEAIEGLVAHAPTGGDFTLQSVLSKFVRALSNVQPAGMPTGGGNDAAAMWADMLKDVPSFTPPAEEVAETWPVRVWGERGNIERALEAADGRLVFVKDVGWHEFHDGVWARTAARPTDDDVAAAWVSRGIEKARELELVKYDATEQTDAQGKAKENSSERDRFRKWIDGLTSTSDTSAARAMRRRARDYDIEIESTRLDAGAYDLAVLNGVIDLRTGQLREASKTDFITKQAPVTYRPDAKRSDFEAFLESSQPDPEMRDYLQKVVGYSATGSWVEQAMFIHHGPRTANGKSTLFNALRDVLGPHYSPANSKAILASQNEKSGQDFIDLVGPRFLALSETAEGSRLDDAAVKSLTAGDWRSDRAHYSANTSYRMTGKLNVSTNHLPHANPDDAMRRRIHIIPWLESFEGREDRDLEAKLHAEREGILAWIVEGAVRWYAERVRQGTGIARPAKALEATEAFFVGEDDVARWIGERTIPADGDTKVSWAWTEDLYDDYRRWMDAEGERFVKKRRQFTTRAIELVGQPAADVKRDGVTKRGLPLKVVASNRVSPW